MNESRGTRVPDVLKDPTAEGGIAPLEASYFQRSLGVPPGIQNFVVQLPDQWLLDSLIKKQATFGHDSKKVGSVWKQFSLLPEDYRHAIGDYLDCQVGYGRRSGLNKWVLLHLECIFEKRRRYMFDRGSRELVGVYIILKQSKRPRDRSAERSDGEEKVDNSPGGYDSRSPRSCYYLDHRGIMRRRSAYDSQTRRGSSKSGYEPNYNQASWKSESSACRGSRPGVGTGWPHYEEQNLGKVHRAEHTRSHHREPSPGEFALLPFRRPTHHHDQIDDDESPAHIQKTVSFAKPEDPPARYPHVQFPPYPGSLPRPPSTYRSLPYNYFNPRGRPGLRPSNNNDLALVGTSSIPEHRVSSPMRSRSRSHSPRPIRRIGTGKYTFDPRSNI